MAGSGAGDLSSVKDRQGRARTIVRRLAKAYPNARCTLNYRSPLELLVATVLSAQCTDARVNLVTRELFRKYRTAADYATARREELEADIKSTGFYRNKAKSLQSCCRELVDRFGGRVPGRMEELVGLAGIGRKTANVILGNAFGQATGVVVDTHVGRLAQRMGLSRQKEPAKIERDLMELVLRKEWVSFSHRMILHGREFCRARKPACERCALNDVCPKIGVQRGVTPNP